MPHDSQFLNNRRTFLGHTTGLLGTAALAHLLQSEANGAQSAHQSPGADAVICLFQHGGPSQMDLFDEKTE